MQDTAPDTQPETNAPQSTQSVPPPTTLSAEDHIAAEIAATLGGALHTEQTRLALVAYITILCYTLGLVNETRIHYISNSVAELVLERRDAISTSTTLSLAARTRETLRSAQFAINSAKRLIRVHTEDGDVVAQLKRERAYYASHKRASEHRDQHIALLDEAARQFGDVLSWRAVMDNRTTMECRAAHGKNFSITNPPAIGLPGLVHAQCRCVAGPPRNNGPILQPSSI